MEITGKDTHIQRFVRCNKITAFWFPLKCQAVSFFSLMTDYFPVAVNDDLAVCQIFHCAYGMFFQKKLTGSYAVVYQILVHSLGF